MRRTAILGLASLLLVACGGRTFGGDDDLDGSVDGAPSFDGGPPPPTPLDGGPIPIPTEDAEPPPFPFDGGPFPIDASPPPPPPFDAGPPPPPPFDAGPPPPPPFDAGPPPPPPPFDAGLPPILNCGNQTCNASTQQCCFTQQSATCIVKGGQCQGGVPLSCTSSASCTNGFVCCASQMGAACAPSCPPQSPQLCKTKAECKPNQSCFPIPQGQGLGVCF